jgi:Protein of unknown function (DUF2695)
VGTRPDKTTRRQHQKAYAEQLKRDREAQLPITLQQLHRLTDHLDAYLTGHACDRTLRETLAWAEREGLDPIQVQTGLEPLGGYCDCEVLANIDTDDQ